MGVEEDERVEAGPNDGYEEAEEPEERDESAESAAESSERAERSESAESTEPEQPEQRLGTDYFGAESEQAQAEDAAEADEATTAEVVGVAGEPAAWSDPAEPYIGPGLAAEPVAEEEPESGYEQAPVEEVTSTYVTTPACQAGQPGQEPSAAGSEYSERMREIQLEFIDDPRQAARDADGLIEDLLRGLTADLQRRRSELGSGLLKTTDAQADEVAPPTEDLRVSVQRSRELVDLLAQARERAVL